MTAPLHVLLVEDSEDDAALIVRELRRAGFEVSHERVDTEAAMRGALGRARWDLVICDFRMPRFSGTAALALLRERDTDAPFIFVSGTIGEDVAVAAMKAGANDYVMKANLKRLAPAVERELRDARTRTERRRAEDLLRRAEARFATVFHASPVAIAIATLADGRFVEANPAWLALIGHRRADLIGRTEAELGIWRDPAALERVIERVRAREAVRGLELEMRAKSGAAIPVLASFEAIEVDGADALLSLCYDLSERKRLEAELRHAQKMEAIGRLAGGVAHDFNNLLMVIAGYADLALADLPITGAERRSLIEIRRATDSATELTKQLLAFGRRQVSAPRVIDLNSLVAATETMLRRLIESHIRVETALARDAGSVRADPVQLEQVLINLAVNARDALPKGGTIWIETGRAKAGAAGSDGGAGDWAFFAVRDDGVGMDAETAAHIFEPFFTTKEVGRGSGLGLASVQSIVEQSGGFITVESAPQRGAEFRVHLPRVAGDAELATASAAPRGSLVGSETVLVVEDSPPIRSLASELLRRNGYCVLEAPDGRAALRTSAEHAGAIDLVLTDIVMPGLGGLELAVALKAQRPAVRVIYTSGYAAAYRQGAADPSAPFLQKPFRAEELLRTVRETLDRSR